MSSFYAFHLNAHLTWYTFLGSKIKFLSELHSVPLSSSVQCCQRERYNANVIVIPLWVIWFSLSLSL